MKTLPLHKSIQENSAISNEVLKRKAVISLVAEHLNRLPAEPKKILAMLYHEKKSPPEIAACFNLTASQISQIHAQTVALVREKILRVLV